MATEARSPGRPKADTEPGTRDRTLHAAQVLFGERGFAGVSMDQLAEAVGVNVRAIYHYFPSKQALFDAASDAAFETYAELVLRHVFAHDDARARLHGFVQLYRELYREQRHLLALLGVIATEAFVPMTGTEGRAPELPASLASAEPILALNRDLVDTARARGELATSIDADAAVALLQAIGAGLGRVPLDDDGPFLGVLDALDLLIDGTLVVDR